MQRNHRRAHTVIWTGLAIIMPVALAVIFASVPKLAADAPAVRLDVPEREGAQQ